MYLDLELCSRFGCSASLISTSAGPSERTRFLPRLWLRARAKAAVGSMPTLDRDSCNNSLQVNTLTDIPTSCKPQHLASSISVIFTRGTEPSKLRTSKTPHMRWLNNRQQTAQIPATWKCALRNVKYLEVCCVGLAIPVCSSGQDGLVVGDCLLGAVFSHHLRLALPDGFQGLLLLWCQPLLTDSHCQALHICTPGCASTCMRPAEGNAFIAWLTGLHTGASALQVACRAQGHAAWHQQTRVSINQA